MRISIRHNSNIPLYRQITEDLARRIQNGSLPAKTRLPTVEELSKSLGTSPGTVRRAYDELERQGLLTKMQGRGTFVAEENAGGGQKTPPPSPATPKSRKEQALAAIDFLLDKLEALSFPPREARILLELKLREREETYRNVGIAAVDCSPEALAVIKEQLSTIPYVDVEEHPLNDVLESFGPLCTSADLCVTTPTHYDALLPKMPSELSLVRLVLTVAPETILELARLPALGKTYILCASSRFAHIIGKACTQYSPMEAEPPVILFGDEPAVLSLCEQAEVLILPPNHRAFSSFAEQEALRRHKLRGGAQITYQYHIDRGSFLYLEQQVESIHKRYHQ